MDFIAIDPGFSSSKTGIAYFRNGVLRAAYSIDLKRVGSHYLLKTKEIMKFCVRMCDTAGLVVEETYFRGAFNKIHQRMLGILDYEIGLIDTIAPKSVKKQVTGSGNADKKQMAKSVRQKLSKEEKKLVNFKDEDMVDAVAIGLAYMIKEKKK